MAQPITKELPEFKPGAFNNTTLENNISEASEINKPLLISVSDLKDHPKNAELNPAEDNEEEYQHLRTSIKRQWIENSKRGYEYGNTDAIIIYRNKQGEFYIIEAGHYRTRAHKELGIPFIKYEYSINTYDENADDLTHFINLESSNSAAKRNESKKLRAVKKWEIYINSYYKRYGIYPNLKSKEFKDFCDARQIQHTHMRKCIKINIYDRENGTNYLHQVSEGDMSLTEAANRMKEKKPKGVYDKNRNDFFKDLRDNPQIIEFALDQAKKHMKYNLEFKDVNGVNVLLDKYIGTETNHITGSLSNVFNSAIVNAFRNSGVKKLEDCVTPQDTQNYFDAQFPSLCKPGFLDERLEVKAGMYGNSITDTSVKGGAGGFGVKPHEYFILIHDDKFTKMFIMLATLDAKDWKSKGKSTQMNIGDWWEKYRNEPEKFMFILGKIRNSNKKAQIEFEDFTA